jgi:hypothetical protein
MHRSLRRSREYDGNRYHLIRDCVQYQKPFAIYNFTSAEQYNTFLKDLDSFGKLNYCVQTISSLEKRGLNMRLVFPSIFVTNEGTNIPIDDFKKIVSGSLTHYKLDSVVCLYDGSVSVFYRDGSHHFVGNQIYGSTQIQEFNSDFYQIESMFYTFLP